MTELFNTQLDRLYDQLNEKNRLTKQHELKLPKPKLSKQGGAKTVWENFGLVAEKLNRPIDHMHKFFTVELATDCNVAKEITHDNVAIDSTSKLIITGKGRYTPDGIVKILQSYVDTYVQCRVCAEMNTTLTKEQRQLFITCDKCLSKWCCQE